MHNHAIYVKLIIQVVVASYVHKGIHKWVGCCLLSVTKTNVEMGPYRVGSNVMMAICYQGMDVLPDV